jgi:Phosphatidylethanolamine-binding protein
MADRESPKVLVFNTGSNSLRLSGKGNITLVAHRVVHGADRTDRNKVGSSRKTTRDCYKRFPDRVLYRFRPRDAIPALYSSYDQNASPPLRWTEGPRGTQSYAILAEDPPMRLRQGPNTAAGQRGIQRTATARGRFTPSLPFRSFSVGPIARFSHGCGPRGSR